MLSLAADSVITGFTLRATGWAQVVGWLTAGFAAKSLVPAIWLGFSLSYSRGDYRESLRRWRAPLIFFAALPLIAVVFRNDLLQLLESDADGDVRIQASGVAKALNVFLMIGLVLVLMNVEGTFRSAVGTARWRIKFVVLGLAVILGARIYVRAQAMLYSAPDLGQWEVESGALLIGCIFLAVAYARTRFSEIDVYPSLAVLRSSITVLLVGAYLFIVGILAQIARRFGGAESFQFQAFVVLLGMSGLALLLLSDRARQRIHVFTARNFSKSRHDSLRVWTALSRRLGSVKDQAELSDASVKLVSETFDVLSVTLWLVDTQSTDLVASASTSPQTRGHLPGGSRESADVIAALQMRASPFELDIIEADWAQELRRLNPSTFPNGGNRWCVPLRAGEQLAGAIVLADRVSGAPYTLEELELLKCVGDQITSVVLNLRLASELASAKELEAFRTMSTFFVHDLKNAAASLNLMLKNLPVHFDDPEFRADALRGIGNTARRIEELIERLSTLRGRPQISPVQTDLNALVTEALDAIKLPRNVAVSLDLRAVARVPADREQIKSVVTNLVLNAGDALERGGLIHVHTADRGHRVAVVVSDNGCGMSPAFVQEQLFRPFQSTKKKGLGIGLFQCRAIVQAHGGSIHAESDLGNGATFVVTLPAGVDR